jgi:hypothetical protein
VSALLVSPFTLPSSWTLHRRNVLFGVPLIAIVPTSALRHLSLPSPKMATPPLAFALPLHLTYAKRPPMHSRILQPSTHTHAHHRSDTADPNGPPNDEPPSWESGAAGSL